MTIKARIAGIGRSREVIEQYRSKRGRRRRVRKDNRFARTYFPSQFVEHGAMGRRKERE